MEERKAPRRIAQTIISSLTAGVVPRIGLPYITVGRKNEIAALLRDIGIVSEGGASFRFISGRYGSGKSFLIQTIRGYAMDRGFITSDADLSPERRLQGTHGQGLATYRELIGNLATKTKSEGGALPLILDRWISHARLEAESAAASSGAARTTDASAAHHAEFGSAGGSAAHASQTGMASVATLATHRSEITPPGDAHLVPPLSEEDKSAMVERKIAQVTSSMRDMVYGYEFASLLTQYYHAYIDGDDETKGRILKWFQGGYETKKEARDALGVNIIINDENWYEYLKLFAEFFRYAGYSGLIVLIDELVNLMKIPNAVSRGYNYEKILTMYNDTLQGKARYLGIIMGGTPAAIEDRRRGVFSYEALRSRLQDGRFSAPGMRDLLGPVIHLEPLSAEEMLILCEKLRAMHSDLYGYETRVTGDDLDTFIRIEYARVGSAENITPREIIRDFIELLNITYQNPSISASEILSSGALNSASMSAGIQDPQGDQYFRHSLNRTSSPAGAGGTSSVFEGSAPLDGGAAQADRYADGNASRGVSSAGGAAQADRYADGNASWSAPLYGGAAQAGRYADGNASWGVSSADDASRGSTGSTGKTDAFAEFDI